MQKITLKFDYIDFSIEELESYLSLIDGINLVKVNSLEDEIYVEYEKNKIGLERIKLEIEFFLDVLNIPSMIFFNKHFETKTETMFINLDDYCCEYCLKGMIEELFEINGVESAYLDYDNMATNAVIKVTYDKNVISKEEIESKVDL